jgi:hypothetical protein
MNSYNPTSIRSNIAAAICTIIFSATCLVGTSRWFSRHIDNSQRVNISTSNAPALDISPPEVKDDQ